MANVRDSASSDGIPACSPGAKGRLVWFAIGLGCCVVALAGIRRAWFLPRTDATWDRIRRTQAVRVGMDATYPPFESVNQTSQLEGYDVDLARELARRWGVGCEFVNVHFDGLYDALRADKCDVLLSALPYDETLTKDILYSPSYFNAGLLLVVRADERSILGVNSLDNRTVGVEVGAAAHLEARRLMEQARIALRIATYTTAVEALQALQSRAVDAAIVDSVTAHGFAREPGGVRPLTKYLTDDQYVIAARAGQGYLWKRIADELARMKQDGFLDGLQERWFVGVTSGE